jgi:hypothetical protein
MSDLRTELIQVAAVAVAIVEDLDWGAAGKNHNGRIAGEVRDERRRQDVLWGPQHHDIHRWLSILMEEVGEAATAALEPEGSLDELAVDS